MPTLIAIRQAVPQDVEVVSGILREVAQWQEQAGAPLWLDGELTPDKIAAEIASGFFFLADSASDPAGTVKFQREDQLFGRMCPIRMRRTFTGWRFGDAMQARAFRRRS